MLTVVPRKRHLSQIERRRRKRRGVCLTSQSTLMFADVAMLFQSANSLASIVPNSAGVPILTVALRFVSRCRMSSELKLSRNALFNF